MIMIMIIIITIIYDNTWWYIYIYMIYIWYCIWAYVCIYLIIITYIYIVVAEYGIRLDPTKLKNHPLTTAFCIVLPCFATDIHRPQSSACQEAVQSWLSLWQDCRCIAPTPAASGASGQEAARLFAAWPWIGDRLEMGILPRLACCFNSSCCWQFHP